MASSDASTLSSAASTISGPIDPSIAARQAARSQTNNYTNPRAAAIQAGQSPQSIVSSSSSSAPLRYPTDLGKYYMTFAFNAYQRPTINSAASLFTSAPLIALPVPNSLVDTYSLDYSTKETGMVGAAADAAIDSYRQSTTQQNQTYSGLVGNVLGSSTSALSESGIAGLASGGTLGQTALQLAGLAQNPMLTVLFNKVNLKKHSFAWKFMPESAQESNVLLNIINQFKKSALPGLTGTAGSLFTVPDVVTISLQPNKAFLYEFKPCVIESVSINYSPNMPSFFTGTGAPTAIEFSISLLEIEIWTQENITGGTNYTNGVANGNLTSAISAANKFAAGIATGGAPAPSQ